MSIAMLLRSKIHFVPTTAGDKLIRDRFNKRDDGGLMLRCGAQSVARCLVRHCVTGTDQDFSLGVNIGRLRHRYSASQP
jgi:hypothetical protein